MNQKGRAKKGKGTNTGRSIATEVRQKKRETETKTRAERWRGMNTGRSPSRCAKHKRDTENKT
eukprot:scaffold2884_cov56-Isochrysis_galbana.AAC.3